MLNSKYYWGESIEATVEAIDSDAVSATLIINTNPRITVTGMFHDGFADVSVPSEKTKVTPGTYEYQLVIIWSDTEIKKYPDVLSCSTCSLPKLTIVPSLDMPQVS